MIPAYTAAQVRAAEEPLLAAGVPLMARAAFALEIAVREELRSRAGAGGVLLLAGSGNNGGDGLFAAAGLARRGAEVSVVLLGDSPHAAGLRAVRATSARVRDLSGLAPTDAAGAALEELALLTRGGRGRGVIVDAVTGIGGRGGLRGVPGAVIAALAAVAATSASTAVVAVDVPSGIGVDDGALPGPVLPATTTVTMGAAKAGLLLPPAARLVGRVDVVNLGLMPELAAVAPPVLRLEDADVARLVAVPGADSDKYRRGVVGVLAGSAEFPGAAVLACEGAAANAGMVRYLGPSRAEDLVLARRPEVVPGPGRVQSWVLGSGIGVTDEARLAAAAEVLAPVLAAPAGDEALVPVVLDAGALELVTPGLTLSPSVVLTPHAGELARLLSRLTHGAVARSEVEAEPARHVREAARLTGATVLLKGSVTLVAAPGAAPGAPAPVLWSQEDATPWLATAGAGDVLAGLLGALLAGQARRVLAEPGAAAEIAAVAALIHGRAAAFASQAAGGGPITALAAARAIPRAVGGLLAAPGTR